MSESNPPVEHDRVNSRPAALAGAAGTVVEWCDYALYGTAALVINPLFFPNVSPLVGTLAAFATFAVGFFASPLGGLVLGHFGDRVGTIICHSRSERF